MDPIQQFKASQDGFAEFPCNLIQSDQFQYDLEEYNKTLRDEDGDYFSGRRRNISLWNLDDVTSEYKAKDKINDVDLGAFCSATAQDPISGFVFVYSATARAPLSCSREQLSRILTHRQAMASFLDLVFTFQAREEPQLMTAFRHEDYLDHLNSHHANPNLERSGLRIQHCFNLISVEYDESQDEWPWPLRQAATYHSFDPVNGRASWISLKGNDQISKRLKKSIPAHPQLRPSALTTPEARFVATLLTHLILFQWCVEKWPAYIDYLDAKVKEHLTKVQFGPVTAMSVPEKIEKFAAMRRSTGLSNHIGPPSRQGTLQKSYSFQAPKLVRKFSDRLFQTRNLATRQQGTEQDGKNKTVELDFDKLFNFSELQNLGQLGDDMQASLLVINQNIKVMTEIMARYEDLISSEDFKNHIKINSCQADTKNFFTKVRQFVRDMETNASRLNNIILSLENAKAQFYGILQYRNIRTGEYFAQSAHDSAKVMEYIAVKTKQETVSMHSITILTLVFLPGTFLAVCFLVLPFLARHLSSLLSVFFVWLSSSGLSLTPPPLQTVFGSGLLNWDEAGAGWVTRMPGVTLFLAICLPMTTLTLGIWLFWNWRSQRQQRAYFAQLAEATRASTAADEKGVVGDEKNV